MEAILIALIAMVGGGGGLVALYKAISDAKANKANREDEADNRLVARLEHRLNDYEDRISELEKQHNNDVAYILQLSIALSKAGFDIPARKETK